MLDAPTRARVRSLCKLDERKRIGQWTYKHRVDDVTASEDTNTINLATTKTQWKKAFNRFNIEYGHSQEHHELRRHQMLRRQEATTQVATTSTATSTVITSTSTSTFLSHQTLIPSGNASHVTQTSVALNLYYEAGNTTFSLPPGFAMTLPNPHFIIGCKHCKTTGNLNLTQGGWELDWPDMEDIVEMDSVADVFKMGFVQLALTNFSTYVELMATPAESGSLQIPLFTAPTAGFRVSIFSHALSQKLMQRRFPSSVRLASCSSLP